MAAKKIHSLNELSQIVKKARGEGKTVVQCHGVFDLLHPGHIRHFAEAKKQGDILAVTITKDEYVNKGPGRPAFNHTLRAESLAALGVVDYVAVNETPTAVEAIKALRPNVYVKGADYENKKDDLTQGIYAEESAVKEVGGKIHFTHDITFSSTQILNQHFNVYPETARKFINHFKTKHSPDQIIDSIEKVKDLKVLVLGDTIVDEYHYCQPLGKSPKETIVSTRYLSEEAFPGGVLAIANHIAAFSDNVDLVTCLGRKDTKQELIESQLNSKISTKYFFREDAPTVVKRRYVEPAFLTKMFQISFFTDVDLPEEMSNEICRYLKETLPQYDLVVVADYGHGFINTDIREILEKHSPFLALNVQTNSANQGYNLVTKYQNADYISIDEPELRLATQSKYTPIEELIADFSKKYEDTVITITRGHNGSITTKPVDSKSRSFHEAASVSSKVVDRVGAGDAYFAITSLLAARKTDPDIIGFVGNAAGAMAVSVVCNRDSTHAVPLFKFVKALLA